jgi:hypothetical protein
MAFAFYIDNNASVARADWFDVGKLRNIDWLENQVGYDFFANIPTSVQNVIESYRVSDIRDWIDGHRNLPAAQLRAESELSEPELYNRDTQVLTSVISHSAIGHSRSTEDTALFQPVLNVYTRSADQTSSTQVNPIQESFVHLGMIQTGMAQINAMKNRLMEISPKQTNLSQNDIFQTALNQISPIEVASSKISPNNGDIQHCTREICFLQNSSIQLPPSSSQRNSSEVSLTSGISIEQLPSTHSSKEWFLHNSFSSTVQTLETFVFLLQEFSLFKPHLTSILPPRISLLANSPKPPSQVSTPLVAPTPALSLSTSTLTASAGSNALSRTLRERQQALENSEFNLSLTDSAFKATPGSASYGRYDLLTTILHEMGHLAGIDLLGNKTKKPQNLL